jgi:predicted membrane channel-forming protein YqfA (hemolysin III family)
MQIKTVDRIIKTITVFSPIPGLMIAGSLIKDDSSAQAYGLFMGGIVIILGIPFIALIGIFGSLLTDKKPKARQYSLLSFLIPALLVILFEFEQAIFNT